MNPLHMLRLFTMVFAITLAVGCSKSDKVDVKANMAALKSAEGEAKVNALVELSKAGPEAAPAVPDLITLLKDTDPMVRRLAAYTLGQIGEKAKPASAELKRLMTDSDRDVVMNAVNALRAIDAASVQGVKVDNVTN